MAVYTSIADLARRVELAFPAAIHDLARDAAGLKEARNAPEGSLLRQHLADARHCYQASRSIYDECRKWLAELGGLVFRHLPDVAAKLRIVTDGTGLIQADPDVDALIGELRTIRAAAVRAAAGDTSPAEPEVCFVNWKEILNSLKMTADKKNWLVKANERYGGPIIFTGQGGQPYCRRDELWKWYKGLADRLAEIQQRHRDKQATAADGYSHGKEGTVVPEISGSVKKRRTDAKR